MHNVLAKLNNLIQTSLQTFNDPISVEKIMTVDENWNGVSLKISSNRNLSSNNYNYTYGYFTIQQNNGKTWHAQAIVPAKYRNAEAGMEYINIAFKKFKKIIINSHGQAEYPISIPPFKLNIKSPNISKNKDFQSFKNLNWELLNIDSNWQNNQYPNKETIILRKRNGNSVCEIGEISTQTIIINQNQINHQEQQILQKYSKQHHLKFKKI